MSCPRFCSLLQFFGSFWHVSQYPRPPRARRLACRRRCPEVLVLRAWCDPECRASETARQPRVWEPAVAPHRFRKNYRHWCLLPPHQVSSADRPAETAGDAIAAGLKAFQARSPLPRRPFAPVSCGKAAAAVVPDANRPRTRLATPRGPSSSSSSRCSFRAPGSCASRASPGTSLSVRTPRSPRATVAATRPKKFTPVAAASFA